jgi:hypothetical protein
MSFQTISQILALAGLLLTGLGGFGAYYFGKREDERQQAASDRTQNELKAQLAALQASVTDRTELIFQALNIKPDTWMPVEMKNVPPGVADYLLLLFVSDKGRITGKVRIKGSDQICFFSTTANNRTPVAVPNLWLPKDQHYAMPTILEFAVTHKTEPDATLSIFTQGWIDTRGREPH